MTAAHCITTGEQYYTVKFGSDSRDADHERGVSEMLANSRFNINYPSAGYDIGLMRLSQAAPSSVQVIPFLPEYMELTEADYGEPVVFVGYGITETGFTDGTRRKVGGYIEWLCNSDDCGQYSTPYSMCFDMRNSGTCSGESGGPDLVTLDGREYVAGITSFGDEDCTQMGCSTKADSFTTFITDFTGGGLGTACNSDSQCAVGFCADGLCCETTCEAECHSCALPGEEGRCRTEASGSPCSDGDLCNGMETCLMGACGGGSENPLDCDDGNPCTDDACHASSGCIHEEVPDGYACGDCQAGVQGDCVNVKDCGGGGCASAPAAPGASPWQGLWLLFLPALAFWLRRRA